ncbi:MAG: DUF1330 domain-containing protein [Betaproteobacteria bacterium]
MAAYCIGQIRVKDAQAWEQYRGRVGATIVQYGGEVMFRGGLQQAFSGTADHDSVVALRFDNLDAAKRWHDSPEYQALVPLREQGAEVALVLYQD